MIAVWGGSPGIFSFFLLMNDNVTAFKLCNWFIEHANAAGSPPTPGKLMHFVVEAYLRHLVTTGEPLFNETPEVWSCGLVIPSIYHEYKDERLAPIEHPSRRQPPLEPDSVDEGMLKAIFDQYDKYTARQLERADTRYGSLWDVVYNDAPEERERIPLTTEMILKYYGVSASGQPTPEVKDVTDLPPADDVQEGR